ncbi:adenylyltransferase [Candidatus Saccharibacteria bacterium QS_5_54_17]|nr:MAG: adenylyltransferase [Candidatus Saccharibacteria bacterium QS_5_54_17]
MSNLIEPHGGKLTNLLVDGNEKTRLHEESRQWKSFDLNQRQLCDLELLLTGGFSPLSGFMKQEDYRSVLDDMRLRDGTLWPMPITLDVSAEFAESLREGENIALRDSEGVMLAVLTAEDIWQPDKEAEAEAVYATADTYHPAVEHLFNQAGDYYIGGSVQGVCLPARYDFKLHRNTPSELRSEFERMGWRDVVAFQTRNPMHRAHVELTLRAAKETGANVLIHPVVGMTKPGDVDHYTRVRVYQKILDKYPAYTAHLSLLPLAMRMGGPREALWHAIIRKNYGCNHFIVGRDHAGPGKNKDGEDFYEPYAAQEFVQQYESELGMTIVPFQMMVYVDDLDMYKAIDELEENQEYSSISGTQLRERLADGRELPEWFTYPEVAEELRRSYPPRYRQGFTVFLTGLSGSGKSTIAKALQARLLEMGGRPVTLLDGDMVRKHLSSELGFSKQHRDINIKRIGFVASEITKNGGIGICAPIAPYEATRQEVRGMISAGGGFVLAYVATPLEICKQRDRKGLYAKAEAGEIQEFTGISDPYEEPEDAEVVLETEDTTPEESAQQIILHLESEGYLAGETDS